MITEQSDEDEALGASPSDRSATDGSPDDPIPGSSGKPSGFLNARPPDTPKAEAAGEPAASDSQMLT
ncbi:hypothetical protein GCM10017643_45590 [Ancylobacter dichloromethanicus]|uniref:Uncharacterized protein n=1 Tax=Ancylobacter dichloromethanicus TaxID=518825 RepID=A0A9W6N1Q7_9HYPH|nr:hypothetical protein GCM10017643_45590 [Ancylobacter dichloromethanicus]